jgi:hypothetical protein
MKSILVILLSCFVLSCNAGILPEQKYQATTKKVCILVYDSKLNKNVQKCRVTKIYKKYEGTPVPEKKK